MYPDRSRGMEEDRDYEVKDRTGEGDGCGCRKDGWDYHAHLPRCKVIRRGPILRDAGMASMPLILRVRGRRKVEVRNTETTSGFPMIPISSMLKEST
uniref:Uncharacterized protein n=1 Tax=Chromera velia CCMP2878 TaxID=1169474 RepID=A0A0K6SA73_9ALVE|eukprot:Cvel_8775.t1-p1 / transcript=Cvel_8775.t1 / gene=Cvel_8775 / organism=Chromera_velia_CCMP2878 / gene_product=hypothetical protein / transcript_product=hypothetical protein / location=Cvel_scaffold490:80861-81148(+) / protein_length=96 / sequence_SO=supercontig / SO=protein_coding / is_pseudo=false